VKVHQHKIKADIHVLTACVYLQLRRGLKKWGEKLQFSDRGDYGRSKF